MIIITCDGGGAMRPTDIALLTNLRRSAVSRALKELKNKGLVYQANPPARKNKQYKLTPLGEKIYDIFDKPIK